MLLPEGNVMETDKVLQAIKNRTTVPKNYLSVTKSLEICGMLQYRDLCLDRLAEYLDDEHITVDYFENLDIRCDEIGMEKVKQILEGYLPSEQLENTIEYVRRANALVESQNAMVELVRSYSTKDIRSFIKNYRMVLAEPEQYENMAVRLRAELKARSILGRCNVKIRRFGEGVMFTFNNAGMMFMLGRAFKRCSER